MKSFKTIESVAEIYTKIKERFEAQNIVIGNLLLGGNIPIIFVQFNKFDDLARFWQEFNSYITAEYLLTLKDEFSKWNAYLFYLTDYSISKSLKYEIENNKFSTRKMVIDFTNKTFNENTLEDILSEYILNENINYSVYQQNIEPFTRDTIINKVLRNVSCKGLSKKEDGALEILNYLAEELKNEI